MKRELFSCPGAGNVFKRPNVLDLIHIVLVKCTVAPQIGQDWIV